MPSHGPRTLENRSGADFAGILSIQLSSFLFVKLVRSSSMPADERNRLFHQCEKMLGISPDSFVFR